MEKLAMEVEKEKMKIQPVMGFYKVLPYLVIAGLVVYLSFLFEPLFRPSN